MLMWFFLVFQVCLPLTFAQYLLQSEDTTQHVKITKVMPSDFAERHFMVLSNTFSGTHQPYGVTGNTRVDYILCPRADLSGGKKVALCRLFRPIKGASLIRPKMAFSQKMQKIRKERVTIGHFSLGNVYVSIFAMWKALFPDAAAFFLMCMIFITSPLSPLLSSSRPLSLSCSLPSSSLFSVFCCDRFLLCFVLLLPLVAAGAGAGAALLQRFGAVFRFFRLCSLSLRPLLSSCQAHFSLQRVACI